MSALDLKIGTDPETFLRHNGKIISAHGIIPGTKKEPYKLEKGAVQLDGVACEFNIDPAKTATEFNDNIEVVLTQVKEIVKKVDKDIEIVFTPIANFEPKYWETVPEEAKILGCDPDFNYKGVMIEKDVTFINSTPIRTAAGHIHLGFSEGMNVNDPAHFEDCRFLAEHFYHYPQPYNGGVRNVAEVQRLKYYGGKAAFRPKPYGVELRQWSNLWVARPETRMKAFNFMQQSLNRLFRG